MSKREYNEEYYNGVSEKGSNKFFEWLDCKNCRHCKVTQGGKWKHCKMGNGTFPRYAKILECKFYDEK